MYKIKENRNNEINMFALWKISVILDRNRHHSFDISSTPAVEKDILLRLLKSSGKKFTPDPSLEKFSVTFTGKASPEFA